MGALLVLASIGILLVRATRGERYSPGVRRGPVRRPRHLSSRGGENPARTRNGLEHGRFGGHGQIMKEYGQFCPVAKTAEVFAERWTPLIIRELCCGPAHFNDLRGRLPRLS